MGGLYVAASVVSSPTYKAHLNNVANHIGDALSEAVEGAANAAREGAFDPPELAETKPIAEQINAHVDPAPVHLNATKASSGAPKIKEAADNTEPRPKFRKSTDHKAWDEAKNGSKPGTKQCPTCKKDITGKKDPKTGRRDYDLDHTKETWSTRKKDLQKKGASHKEVNDEYQKDVRVQCPRCNRSHNLEPGKSAGRKDK
jgi:hypothetical protein